MTEAAITKYRDQIAKKRSKALVKFQKQIGLKPSPEVEFL